MPLVFFCIDEWHLGQKFELFPTTLGSAPLGCLPEPLSQCVFTSDHDFSPYHV